MNKTLKRALPIVIILVAILAAVMIFTGTNTSADTTMISNKTDKLFDDGTVTVTKEDVYSQLRYDKEINTIINDQIDDIVITNAKIGDGSKQKELRGDTFDFNYVTLVKTAEYNSNGKVVKYEDLIKDSIKTAVFGTDDEEAILKNYEDKDAKLYPITQAYIDNAYLNNRVTLDVTWDADLDTFINKIYETEELSKQFIYSHAKKEFVRDLISQNETTDDDEWYLDEDEWNNLYEDEYDSRLEDNKAVKGIMLEIDSVEDLERALEMLYPYTGTEPDTDSIYKIDSRAIKDLSDDYLDAEEMFRLNIELYDYFFGSIRHGEKTPLADYIADKGLSITLANSDDIMDLLTDMDDVNNPFNYTIINPDHRDANEDDEVKRNYFVHIGTDVTTTSSSLKNYLFDTLTVSDDDTFTKDKQYTAGYRSYSSKQYMLFKFEQIEDETSFNDFKSDDSNKDELDNIIKVSQEDALESTLNSTFVTNKYQEFINEKEIKIYDKLIEKAYAASNSSYETVKDTSTTDVFSYGDKTFTADDVFEILEDTVVVEKTNTLAQEKIILNSKLFTDKYGEETDLVKSDNEDVETLRESIRTIKLSYGAGSLQQCTEYDNTYGWVNYLNHCFGVQSEETFLYKLAYQSLVDDFALAMFTNEYKIVSDDITIDPIENKLDYTSTDFIKSMTDLRDDYFSATATHLLISKPVLNKDTEFHNPIEGDLTTEEIAVMELLLEEAYEFSKKEDFDEKLIEFQTDFNDAPFGVAPSYTSSSHTVGTSDIEDLFAYAKQLGLKVEQQSLGEFDQNTMVKTFQDRVELLVKDAKDENSNDYCDSVLIGDDAEDSGCIDAQAVIDPVITEFGYHIINLSAVGELPTAIIDADELDDFKKGLMAYQQAELENFENTTSIIPTEAQLDLYVMQRDDANRSIKLPSGVTEAIEYFYDATRTSLYSANMIKSYFIEEYYNKTNNEDFKEINTKESEIFVRQSQSYKK